MLSFTYVISYTDGSVAYKDFSSREAAEQYLDNNNTVEHYNCMED